MTLNKYSPSMGTLSNDLKQLGYSRTERESPFDDDGILWSKGYELVCDETAIVIRTDSSRRSNSIRTDDDESTYRYYNSDKVRMPGGYASSYDWGRDEDRTFYY